MRTRRRFTAEFKAKVALEAIQGHRRDVREYVAKVLGGSHIPLCREADQRDVGEIRRRVA